MKYNYGNTNAATLNILNYQKPTSIASSIKKNRDFIQLFIMSSYSWTMVQIIRLADGGPLRREIFSWEKIPGLVHREERVSEH